MKIAPFQHWIVTNSVLKQNLAKFFWSSIFRMVLLFRSALLISNFQISGQYKTQRSRKRMRERERNTIAMKPVYFGTHACLSSIRFHVNDHYESTTKQWNLCREWCTHISDWLCAVCNIRVCAFSPMAITLYRNSVYECECIYTYVYKSTPLFSCWLIFTCATSILCERDGNAEWWWWWWCKKKIKMMRCTHALYVDVHLLDHNTFMVGKMEKTKWKWTIEKGNNVWRANITINL